MSKAENIVDATSELIPDWAYLRHELWPMHTYQELRDELSDFLHDPLQKAWLYLANGTPIGFIEMSIKQNAIGCTTDRAGYVEAWYIKPEFQRKGIGSALLEIGESWAKSLGCTEMASDTTEDYPVSVAAHLKAGFVVVRRATHFYKKI